VWVDMLFIPAFVIVVIDSVRMVQNIREMKTEHGRTVAVW
jgi:D-serine deaminase-like pyridoxal phosphate-dependent protein